MSEPAMVVLGLFQVFAVEIYLGKPKLGYVPRSNSNQLGRLPKQGAKLECRVVESDPEAEVWNRVRVEILLIQTT